MAAVSVHNSEERPLCVSVEPLGEDFWIVQGETLTFGVPDAVPTVAWHGESGASVWVNEGDPYDVVVTTKTGEAVECGYQRPSGPFEAPSS